jgi:mediator of RNA polymerase II transcription subunit 21
VRNEKQALTRSSELHSRLLTSCLSSHRTVEPIPTEEFRTGLVELSRDLILKEQQIEMLVSTLPGLDSSEQDQEQSIRELEEELRVAEEQRQEAIREKEQVLADLGKILKSVRRPL